MSSFGQLKRLNPRDIWSHEASDFTPWLADHISDLGESLGFDLELAQREASVGSFSLDLLAKDLGRNRTVIIENQLTETNHDHLGKLITYASGFDAGTVIWIAESFREEHRQALEWLNQVTGEEAEFFAVTVEILQIDDSLPAYNFKPIVYPNEWRKDTHQSTVNEPTEKMVRYQEFFQQLIDELRENHRFTNARKGQPQNWYSFASGVNGILYGVAFSFGRKVRVEVYIDFQQRERNKALFDQIYSKKEKIEDAMGQKLTWERLDDKRACRIALYRSGSIEDDDATLQEIMKWAVQELIDIKKVLGPRVLRIAKD